MLLRNVHRVVRGGDACHIAEDGTELACDAGLDTLRFMPWFTTRDLLEWPGIGLDLKNHPICPSPEWCGLALGCRNGYCGPCSSDADCAVGETCVLEQCVLQSNVAGKRASECGSPGEAWCMLNGVTGDDPRGNSRMVSACTDFTGPSPFAP